MDMTAAIDCFFAGKPHEWALFETLRRQIASRWPDTQLRVMKTCISFDDPKPYMYVSYPRKKSMEGLMVSISLKQMQENPRFFLVVPVSASRYTVHIHVRSEDEIDETLFECIAFSRR